MKKVKAHVKLYAREATATLWLDDEGDIIDMEDVESIDDFDDVEIKSIIYEIN